MDTSRPSHWGFDGCRFPEKSLAWRLWLCIVPVSDGYEFQNRGRAGESSVDPECSIMKPDLYVVVYGSSENGPVEPLEPLSMQTASIGTQRRHAYLVTLTAILIAKRKRLCFVYEEFRGIDLAHLQVCHSKVVVESSQVPPMVLKLQDNGIFLKHKLTEMIMFQFKT
jgi:hypothetical protein